VYGYGQGKGIWALKSLVRMRIEISPMTRKYLLMCLQNGAGCRIADAHLITLPSSCETVGCLPILLINEYKTEMARDATVTEKCDIIEELKWQAELGKEVCRPLQTQSRLSGVRREDPDRPGHKNASLPAKVVGSTLIPLTTLLTFKNL